jgi:hypothetical protein
MNRNFVLVVAVVLATACTPKRVIEASSTIEDLPNEPVAAGAEAGAAPATPAEAAKPVPAPDAGVVTAALVRVELPEGFSVLFPVEPQVQRSSSADKNGTVSTVAFTTNVNGVVFAVTRSDYPEASAAKWGPKKMLASARNILASQAKGKVEEQKDLELAGHPGQLFTVVGQDRMVKGRSAIVQNQLYTLVVVYNGATPESADAFLTSLSLKETPSASKK